MGEKITLKSFKEMPICAMSVADMTYNLTGSWRNVRPYYDFKVSPCRLGCPTMENIQRYIYLVTQEKYEDAWRELMEQNPMPSVTGRVCFHPCMEKCTRKDFDQAINIPAIERSNPEAALNNEISHQLQRFAVDEQGFDFDRVSRLLNAANRTGHCHGRGFRCPGFPGRACDGEDERGGERYDRQ